MTVWKNRGSRSSSVATRSCPRSTALGGPWLPTSRLANVTRHAAATARINHRVRAALRFTSACFPRSGQRIPFNRSACRLRRGELPGEGLPVALGGVQREGEAAVRAREHRILNHAHGAAAVLGEGPLHSRRQPGDLGAAAGENDVVADALLVLGLHACQK